MGIVQCPVCNVGCRIENGCSTCGYGMRCDPCVSGFHSKCEMDWCKCVHQKWVDHYD